MSNSSIENGDTSPERCLELIYGGLTPQADNDISGIGVVVAFVVSAYLTLILVIAAYVTGHIDESLLRPMDTLVFRRQGMAPDQYSHVTVILRQTVLAFSDQQIVTGIAVLIAGFARFPTAMNCYHWQMAIYLAWMSSSTHLSALTMLSAFLRERRMLLIWRLTGMLILGVMLLVALVPTWANYWAVDQSPGELTNGWAVPAACFWARLYDGGINTDAPIGSILLIVSYIWKGGGVFQWSHTWFHRWVRSPWEYVLERLLQRLARSNSLTGCKLRFKLVMAVYVATVLVLEFTSSFAASLWLSIGGLAWGSVEIIVPRIDNAWWASQENSWTFGQVIAMVLLIQPLGAVVEHVRSRKKGESHPAIDIDDGFSETTATELESGIDRRKNLSPRVSAPRSHRLATTASPSDNRRSLRTRSRSRSRRRSIAAKPMSEIFAQLEIRPWRERRGGDLPGHQRMLYDRRFFKSLFWLLHVTVAVVIGLVSWIAAENITTDVAETIWIDVVQILGLAALGQVVWTVIWMPFSKVFK